MIKNNVELLDMDEHQREMRENCGENVKEIIAFCRKYDLICDMASSDVVIYIRDETGAEIGIA